MFWTVDCFRSYNYIVYVFNMVLSMYSLKYSFVYPHSDYRNSGVIFQSFCSLFIVTRYDVDKDLNLGSPRVMTKCI